MPSSAVCVKFLEDALGQKLPRRPQPGPGEQFTIFQFWSYVEALDSPSMDAYVTETAEEGEAAVLHRMLARGGGGSEGVNDGITRTKCATPHPNTISFSVAGTESELR